METLDEHIDRVLGELGIEVVIGETRLTLPVVVTPADLRLLGQAGQVIRHTCIEQREPDAALFFHALRRAERKTHIDRERGLTHSLELTVPLPPCALRTAIHAFKPQLEAMLSPEARDVALLLVVCNAVLDATADA